MALSQITKSNVEKKWIGCSVTVRGFEVHAERRSAALYQANLSITWDEKREFDTYILVGKVSGLTINELKTAIMKLINDLGMTRTEITTLASRLNFTGDIDTLMLIKNAENAPLAHRNEKLERVQSMDKVYEKFNRAVAWFRPTAIKFSNCGECAYIISDHKVWLLRREQFGMFTFTHETDLTHWLKLGGNIHDLTNNESVNKNLIAAENFEVVKVNDLVVEKTPTQEKRLSGWAIKDKRNNKLISMNDDYFYCLRCKKTAVMVIINGLYAGFTHFDGLTK